MMQKQTLSKSDFLSIRKEVIESWPTGKDAQDLEGNIAYQQKIPESKRFSKALTTAKLENKVLIQPRAGVALVDEHIKLLKFLEPECDLLPTTIDAYTRHNKYEEAQKGIDRSVQAGHSLLNGFPAVNHGLSECRRVTEAVNKPIQIRHGTPDARLLAEISLAAGFTAYEGGGISYNIPYAKKVPLKKSITDWQYVDRLVGIYEQEGVSINREPFGPLTGTLVPPFISHTVAILEGLLALEQGVRSLTLGYGQVGHFHQDIAAIRSLESLAHEFFSNAGYQDYELTTVFHQWMGGFPENEARAFSVIAWGGALASLAGATKVIVKTPHEAMGIPTKEANVEGLRATRQIINMLDDQMIKDSPQISQEVDLIKREVRFLMSQVMAQNPHDLVDAIVKSFEAGIIEVPFAPSVYNRGKLVPIRDNEGAIRIFDRAAVPMPPDVIDWHRSRISERAAAESRPVSFQMVIDDIYAISKGRLVGRPNLVKKEG